MNQKRMKSCMAVFVAVGIFTLMAFSASAAGISGFDPAKAGTLTVTYRTAGDETPVPGAEITLYRVADGSVRQEDEAYIYTFTPEFAETGVELREPYDAKMAETFAQTAAQKSLAGQVQKTDANGKVKFEGLMPGLYLVVQTGAVEGFSVCAPFLSCIPTADETAWVYDIDASPKADIWRQTDLTVRKVWNDDGEHRPSEVTIRLLHNGEEFDRVVLSENNGWSYTWKKLTKDEGWSVEEAEVPQGYTATYEQNGTVFTVQNTPGLIHTGQLNWPIPVLAGSGLALVAAGWVLVSFGKKKKHE